MTKKRIHIDDFFRRGLGNMQLPVEGNDWFAMQASLAAAQKRRKRRTMWLWVVGVLLLVGTGTGIYFLSDTKDTNTPAFAQQQKTSSAEQQPANTNISSPSQQNGSTQTQSTETANSNSGLGSDDTTTQSESKFADDNKSVRPKQKTVPKQSGNNKSGGKETTDMPSTDNGANAGSKETSTTKETENKEDNKPIETSHDETPMAETKPLVIATNDTTKPGEESEPLLAKADSIEPESKTTKNPTLGKLSPFSIGFNLSPTASMFAAQNQTKYGSILRNGTKNGLAIASLITLNYSINNWMFGTGLGFTSVATRGNYRYTHQVYDSIPVSNPGGQIIGYFYTNFRDSSQNLTIGSRYTYITLPLQASYNLKLTEKLGLQLGGSVQLQRLASVSGEAISPFSLFSTEAAKQKDVLRRWNASIAIQTGVYYKLSPQWQLNAGLQLSSFARGVYSNAIGTVVRPRNFGLHLGVNYNLTK
ncbi:MAG: outer membrane beta-barrel protein [Bacteroidota bacterium]